MSILRYSLISSLGTLLSRLSGLTREIVMASVFGASVFLDAFFVAFRIPNLFRDMLAEGALGSSFTKNYSQVVEKSKARATNLTWNILTFTFCITSVLVALGIIFRHYLIRSMTAFSDKTQILLITQAEQLTILLLPLLIISSLGAILAGVLCQKKRFFHNSISPVLFNIGCIVCTLILGPILKDNFNTVLKGEPVITSLAIGALLGGIMQIIWLAYPIIKDIFPKKLKLHWQDPNLIKTFKEGLPMMIAASVTQINILINTNFATSLNSGAVSWLNFAFRPLQLPVGLFAVAAATVILPVLSINIQNQNQKHKNTRNKKTYKLSHYLTNGIDGQLRWVIWIMAFCMCALIYGSYEIITILFYGGEFGEFDTIMTHQALMAYAIGIIGYGMNKILFAYYYATGNTIYGLIIAIICLILSLSANLIIISKFGHIGLAAVSGIIMLIQASLLYLKVDKLYTLKKFIMSEVFFAVIAVIFCGLIMYFISLTLNSVNSNELFLFDILIDKFLTFTAFFNFWSLDIKLANLCVLSLKCLIFFLIILSFYYLKQKLNNYIFN